MLRRIDIDGTQEVCFDEGRSRNGTLLLLHGFPDVPTTFDALADELVARGYRVLRPYLPGYAPSSYPGPFDVASLCTRLLRVLDPLCDEPCHLIGHDWGAVLGYALLRRAPERFLSGTCLSVPHPLHLLRRAHKEPAQLGRSAYML